MIVLRILGPLHLDGLDRRRELAILAGEKRVAVLVYLLLAGRGHYIRRDTLLALFWPELDDTHARGALRALVHQLRGALGPTVLLSRSDQELGVDLTQVGCDALDFEQACQAGDREAAFGLYGGPLLEGFALSGSAGFEEWLAGERARIQGLARDLAWQGAEQARAAGLTEAEITALRRLLAWAPYDEGAARQLMSALDRAGNRAEALQLFEQFSARLLADLELSPGPETIALSATLRSRVAATPDPAPVTAARDVPADVTATAVAPPARTAASRFAPARIVLGLMAVAIVLTLGWPGPSRSAGDARLVAVLPFDVTGPDTGLAQLGRAVPLLLERRLNQEVGPRTADAGAVFRAAPRLPAGTTGTLPHDAVAVARAVGAGRVLIGVVGPAPAGMVVTATLLDAATGEARARASVEGATDSLDQVLDHLTALILIRTAGEPAQRIPHLTGVPLPALLHYLEGQALLRAGNPDQARDAFARAVEVDSTFATAALAASVAAGAGGGPWVRRGLELAWRWQTRLMGSDREVVSAKLGPRYPGPSSLVERLAAWEVLVPVSGAQPYQAEVLYGYGDFLLHFGPLIGIRDAHQQARVALAHAYQSDSSQPASLQHLADLAFIHRDTVRLRPLIARLLRRGDGDTAQRVARWMLEAALGHPAGSDRLARELDQAPLYNLPQQAGIALEDAERVAELWRTEATTLEATAGHLRLLRLLSLNRGRPGRAAVQLDSAYALAGAAPHLARDAGEMERDAILAALYWDADTTAALRVLPSLVARVEGAAPRDSLVRSAWLRGRCALEEWRLWHGAVTTVAPAITSLTSADQMARLCTAVLEVLAASVRAAPDVDRRLRAVDSLARTGPPGWIELFPHGNLLISRLFERRGRLAEAYAASRRRGIYYVQFNEFLSTHLREEGRLALAVGDSAGAILAWQHFLGLRDAPEPALIPEREQIRSRLAALVASAR